MLTFLPLFAKLGLWFLDKYISNAAKKEALKKQWLDSIEQISHGVAESAALGEKYYDAKKRLDAKFDAIKNGEKQ